MSEIQDQDRETAALKVPPNSLEAEQSVAVADRVLPLEPDER